MHRRKLLVLLVVGALSAGTLVAATMQCPVHELATGHSTGKSKFMGGKRWIEFKCIREGGHTFWGLPQ